MNKRNPISKFASVVLAAAVVGSFTLFSSPVQATISPLVGTPTWVGSTGPTAWDGSYYSTSGGIIFTVPTGFAPGSNVVVDSLGRFYFGPGTYNTSSGYGYAGSPAGNTGIRTQSLIKVTSLGTSSGANLQGTLVAQVTLDPAANPQSGTAIDGSNASGGWQYANLATPYTLEKGATYVLLGSEIGWGPANPGQDQVYSNWSQDKTPFTATATGLTYIGSAVDAGSGVNGAIGSSVTGLQWFDPGAGAGNYQLGPQNLQFELTVPEPSSLALLGLGGLLVWRRMRRGKQIV